EDEPTGSAARTTARAGTLAVTAARAGAGVASASGHGVGAGVAGAPPPRPCSRAKSSQLSSVGRRARVLLPPSAATASSKAAPVQCSSFMAFSFGASRAVAAAAAPSGFHPSPVRSRHSGRSLHSAEEQFPAGRVFGRSRARRLYWPPEGLWRRLGRRRAGRAQSTKRGADRPWQRRTTR